MSRLNNKISNRAVDRVLKGLNDSAIRRFEPFKRAIDTVDKVGLLFTDVEVEGKKRGYERAAAEYEEAFIRLEKLYKETQDFLEIRIQEENRVADELIQKLRALEKEKEKITMEVQIKVSDVASTYHVPETTVAKAFSGGTIFNINSTLGILDFVAYKKGKKLCEAEAKGYIEAKHSFDAKIKQLQQNYEILKRKSEREVQNLLSLIQDILNDIVIEETKIAELKIALNN